MKKNKKGLMLKFIITIIIALAVFIPACGFVSKLFRTSDQAEQSFESLMDELDEFAENAEEGEEKLLILILDKDSYVAKFSGEDIVGNHLRGNDIWRTTFFQPPECQNKDCLVFCQEIDYIEDFYVNIASYYHQDPLECKDVKKVIILEDLNIRSFIIARDAVDTGGVIAVKTPRYYGNNFYVQVWDRRAPVNLIKEQETTFIRKLIEEGELPLPTDEFSETDPEGTVEQEWEEYCLIYPDSLECFCHDNPDDEQCGLILPEEQSES